MTLLELSVEYRAQEAALAGRMAELTQQLARTKSRGQRQTLEERIHLLATMHREARELAVLTERYYDRGYHRNDRYTL